MLLATGRQQELQKSTPEQIPSQALSRRLLGKGKRRVELRFAGSEAWRFVRELNLDFDDEVETMCLGCCCCR